MTELNDTFRELLLETGIDDSELVSSTLSVSQQRVISLRKEGKNILILGSAGCGKSTVIKTIKEQTTKNIILCATTGISAYNIGGITIHSFMGFGTGEKSLNDLYKKIQRNPNTVKRLRSVEILVIDEVSMLSAELFEKIDDLLKLVRNSKKPFGGIQVILSGDFLQLLPVFKKKAYDKNEMDERLIIESDIFLKYFKKTNTIQLTTNFRQAADNQYATLLQNVRHNQLTSAENELLTSRMIKPPKDILCLVSTNKVANNINLKCLNKLEGETTIFKAMFNKINYGTSEEDDLSNVLHQELENQVKQKDLVDLRLKKNARVMLVANLDVASGLVNGSMGTITNIEPCGVNVLFDNGIQSIITPHTWELSLQNVIVTVDQIPLILAYSITIHKSQSLTLESASMDLETCFTDHMVYVALSRLTSSNGLYLRSFKESKIKVNKKMQKYLSKLKLN